MLYNIEYYGAAVFGLLHFYTIKRMKKIRRNK